MCEWSPCLVANCDTNQLRNGPHHIYTLKLFCNIEPNFVAVAFATVRWGSIVSTFRGIDEQEL